VTVTALFEIIGTVAFAFSGAFVALRRRLDIFGQICCAMFTATGGGIIRDLILGNTPPLIFRDPSYLIVAMVVGGATSAAYVPVLRKHFRGKMRMIFSIMDAIGLAVFTMVGMQTAIFSGYGKNAFLVCTVGVITAVGGGALRDICTGRPPVILQKEIYATASILGSILYYLGRQLIPDGAASAVAMAVIFLIRMWAVRYDINLPFARKKSDEH